MDEVVVFTLAAGALIASALAVYLARQACALPAAVLRTVQEMELTMPSHRAAMATLAERCEQVLESAESKRKRVKGREQTAENGPTQFGDAESYKAHLESGGKPLATWEAHLGLGR